MEKYLNELLSQSPDIDSVLLACTHYPLLSPKILEYLPEGIRLISQGSIVAESLADYLNRHPELESRLSRSKDIRFFTTDNAGDFEEKGSTFFGAAVQAKQVQL